MAIKGNKGEWSEIYTLFRLLGEGKVHAGDANLQKLDLYYPIISVIREEGKRYEYKPLEEKNIVVIDEDGVEYAKIPMTKFLSESAALFKKIKSGEGRTFSVPDAECFMHRIGCSKLKAPSKDKSDIHIVIHDFRTGTNPKLGFSIKSQLGSDSTLLNATTATNITYMLVGPDMSDLEMNEINNIESHLSRMKAIVDRGYTLKYYDIEHSIFKNNLLFIETSLPDFIASCLVYSNMPGASSSIRKSVENVVSLNPLRYTGKNIAAFYEHKMKVLLTASALGMTAAKEWNGHYDANGGYLVVRRDGEIVCYHFYNTNDVENYLYYNTKFERGSRKRHGFGSLYRGKDGKIYFKLNLQIRFTN